MGEKQSVVLTFPGDGEARPVAGVPQVFCAEGLLKAALLESSNLHIFEILFIKRALGNEVLMSTRGCRYCKKLH